jgi:hypothetical protein
MKKHFPILVLCVVALITLACAGGSAKVSTTPAPAPAAPAIQPSAQAAGGYTSFEDVDRNILIARELGNKRGGEKNGPAEPISGVSLSVSSPSELENIDSYGRSLLFYYDTATRVLNVATKLYGPDDVMQSTNQRWYLGGYARQAFEMDVYGDVGRAKLPLVPGDYTLYHWVGPTSDPTWTYPLWSNPSYGLRMVGGEENWGYQVRVLPSGQVITLSSSSL